MTMEDVIAKNKGNIVLSDERRADRYRLSQTVWILLNSILEIHPPLLAGIEQLHEPRQILRRRNDQHITDIRQHQNGQRMIDHRLVENRQQLLADSDRGRVQSRACPPCQDDALSCLGHVSSLLNS